MRKRSFDSFRQNAAETSAIYKPPSTNCTQTPLSEARAWKPRRRKRTSARNPGAAHCKGGLGFGPSSLVARPSVPRPSFLQQYRALHGALGYAVPRVLVPAATGSLLLLVSKSAMDPTVELKHQRLLRHLPTHLASDIVTETGDHVHTCQCT